MEHSFVSNCNPTPSMGHKATAPAAVTEREDLAMPYLPFLQSRLNFQPSGHTPEVIGFPRTGTILVIVQIWYFYLLNYKRCLQQGEED